MMPSVEGDECMSDISEQKLLIDLLDTSFSDKADEMQISSIHANESSLFESPKKGIPREIYAAGDSVLMMAVDSPLSQVKEECKRSDGSPFIIDLTNTDNDGPSISMEDSDGVTVAVVVESKLAKVAAEKLRTYMYTLPRLKGHKVHDDDVKEYFPIMDKTGKITGMCYSSRYGKIFSHNGRACMRKFVWVDFMDRLNSEEDHYRVVDKYGFMIGIKSIRKHDRNDGSVLSVRNQKKIVDYFELKKHG
jgi:hypothetical protein